MSNVSITVDSFKSATLKNINDFRAERADKDNKILDNAERVLSNDHIVSFLIAADVASIDRLARNTYLKMTDLLQFMFATSSKLNDVNKTIFINAVNKHNMNEVLTLDEVCDVLLERKKNEKRDYLYFKRDAVQHSTLCAQYRPTLDAMIALNMISEHTVADFKCKVFKLNTESALVTKLCERLAIAIEAKDEATE